MRGLLYKVVEERQMYRGRAMSEERQRIGQDGSRNKKWRSTLTLACEICFVVIGNIRLTIVDDLEVKLFRSSRIISIKSYETHAL
jgi:hypothetical protein